ncbi:hypothetical protein [Uliginosibacterium sp. 31-12]|uniref:hypothetical protein n=1 Tax=Uliginosibacterium sp. 31-12 TaxID=3062781 RepID=UPI0026E42A96|nr:hypothetical protein [Uliginosibacterium sp. 31-12]MDO6385860.1 hypothetical protein [Uliginosibacterium sp. 31-12]
MQSSPLLRLSLITSFAALALSACGGGNDLADTWADITKSVKLDSYSDSCDGENWKTVSRTSGNQTILMTITVNTTGDVEPLKPEWGIGDGHSIGSGLVSATSSTDGTGRKFTQTLVINSTGDISYRFKIRDKNDDLRYETTCKVHVN